MNVSLKLNFWKKGEKLLLWATRVSKGLGIGNFEELNSKDETRVKLVEVYTNNIWWQHKIIFSQRNFAEHLVDWDASIVKWWRLEDYTECSTNTRECKHPKEEPIKHHRDEFPVLNNLKWKKNKNRWEIERQKKIELNCIFHFNLKSNTFGAVFDIKKFPFSFILYYFPIVRGLSTFSTKPEDAHFIARFPFSVFLSLQPLFLASKTINNSRLPSFSSWLFVLQAQQAFEQHKAECTTIKLKRNQVDVNNSFGIWDEMKKSNDDDGGTNGSSFSTFVEKHLCKTTRALMYLKLHL